MDFVNIADPKYYKFHKEAKNNELYKMNFSFLVFYHKDHILIILKLQGVEIFLGES